MVIKLTYEIDSINEKIVDEFKSFDEIYEKYKKEIKVLFPTYTQKKFTSVMPVYMRPDKTLFGHMWVSQRIFNKYDNIRQLIEGLMPQHALVDEYPQLVEEWDYDKNKGIDIRLISKSSGKKVWWCCKNSHKSYFAKVNNRAAGKTGCLKCSIDSKTNTDEKVKEHIEKYVKTIKSTEIGDDKVIFICELLEKTGKYKGIINTGASNDKTDIIVSIGDKKIVEKCIQVKTLSNEQHSGCYGIDNITSYDDDMLIVGVNNDKNKFAVALKKDFDVKEPSFSFNGNCSRSDMIFTDEKEFAKRICKLLPDAKTYTGYESSDSNVKENNSLRRIYEKCIENDCKFTRHITSDSAIDLFIDGVPFQAKYSSNIKGTGTLFTIDTKKAFGTVNKQRIRVPYSIFDPFDYLIVELGGTENRPEKYHGSYWVYPKSELIKRDGLSTPLTKGKMSVTICSPDYKTPHWSKPFWIKKGEPFEFKHDTELDQIQAIKELIQENKKQFLFNEKSNTPLYQFMVDKMVLHIQKQMKKFPEKKDMYEEVLTEMDKLYQEASKLPIFDGNNDFLTLLTKNNKLD